jgi:hypothetical protein
MVPSDQIRLATGDGENGDGFQLDFRTVFHSVGIKNTNELHGRVANETDLVRVP